MLMRDDMCVVPGPVKALTRAFTSAIVVIIGLPLLPGDVGRLVAALHVLSVSNLKEVDSLPNSFLAASTPRSLETTHLLGLGHHECSCSRFREEAAQGLPRADRCGCSPC